MDLKHLRTFVTVAELGTVSRAALQLRITQPALSRQIADLERELGLTLFDRVGRRLLLTGEGDQLLGVLTVYAHQAQPFGDDHKYLAERVAEMLAVRLNSLVEQPVRPFRAEALVAKTKVAVER